MTTLGFVGLGHMGGSMAARFLAAGFESVSSGPDGVLAGLSATSASPCKCSPSPRVSCWPNAPLPSAATANQLLTLARGLGYERRDIAALFEVLAP
jgi:3-hydroxyisobutyrate dehydrogenase-like beta-hydroxyacid dehydrogenase